MNAVEFRNVFFTYQGGRDAGLRNINLEIRQGEFILLTGRSGCGKTTLTRLMNGLIPHFFPGELRGRVLVNGRDVGETASYELAEMVGSVFQDPRSQFFTTNTVSEVAFGCENLDVPGDEMNRRVDGAFGAFQMEELKNRSIFSLSSGEKQKIALASTYAMRPGIYVLDEPSGNLDIQSAKMLGTLLKALKEQGATVIVSEHRLYYLMELADRVLYMENGELVCEWTPGQALSLNRGELVRLGLRAFAFDGLDGLDFREKGDLSVSEPSFEAKDISVAVGGQALLKEVGVSVAPGDGQGMIGITGANGVGKTSLVKCLCGLQKSQGGTVAVDGCTLSNRRRARNMYFVMQDTDYQLFTESVEDELRLGNKGVAELDEKITRSLDMLGLSQYRDAHPMALSGGQKQRVTIAAAAVSPAKVLFFDEPTSGLDGESMRNVGKILAALNQKGKLIFIISHDLEFLLRTCDRVIHLEKGGVKEDFILDGGTVGKLKALLGVNGE